MSMFGSHYYWTHHGEQTRTEECSGTYNRWSLKTDHVSCDNVQIQSTWHDEITNPLVRSLRWALACWVLRKTIAFHQRWTIRKRMSVCSQDLVKSSHFSFKTAVKLSTQKPAELQQISCPAPKCKNNLWNFPILESTCTPTNQRYARSSRDSCTHYLIN